ncbi:hypothetical protein C8A00DRAFT_43831 [Chaetomidium leptoderma]|uniref:F-box domain-containing protein n=1 Tax=Chaetomidium leptoderma TaxID=669021 RepID=A0AAN6VKZ7_9PEZI|nr:hypothetical protein C8A00DRAFT_43831 [Chaetomidium leptoderma]
MAASGDAASGDAAPDSQPNPADELSEAKVHAALAEGRNLVRHRQYSKALHAIMEAVYMCQCNPAGNGKTRHGKDKSCHISQCIGAVNSKDADALYKVAKIPCACGYSWPSCVRPLHMMALDALAECLDKAEQHTSAISTSLAMIRLDPASAVGYCRGAKILQYLLKNCSLASGSPVNRSVVTILRGDSNPPSAILLRRLLDRFIEHGLHNTEFYRRGPKSSFDVVLQMMAYKLKIGVARRDPVKAFPPEVLTMVFSLLNRTDISRCLRVSQRWHGAIMQDAILWADLRLGRPGNPGRLFPKFLLGHPGIKTFVLGNASAFQLTTAKLGCLLHTQPQLRQLYLDSGKPYGARQSADSTESPYRLNPHLTHLTLISFDMTATFEKLVQLNVSTLEVLDLINTGRQVNFVLRDCSLPNLRKLRIIEGHLHPSKEPLEMPLLEIGPIVNATPSLEQFHLDGVGVAWATSDSVWPSLSKLILGPNLRFSPLIGAIPSPYFIPPLSSNMRSIEILGSIPDIAFGALFTKLRLKPPYPMSNSFWSPIFEQGSPYLPKLEVFRCMAPALDPTLLRHIIEPAAKSDTLKVLDLAVVPRSTFPSVNPSNSANSTFEPVRDLPFALSENLHTLGLHDFNFYVDPTSRFGATSEFDGKPFLDWVDCFPNLHTVACYPGQWQRVDALIMQLIVHPKVKVIHQDCLKGVAWDEASILAEKHGVELHHTPNHMPVNWPMLEE